MSFVLIGFGIFLISLSYYIKFLLKLAIDINLIYVAILVGAVCIVYGVYLKIKSRGVIKMKEKQQNVNIDDILQFIKEKATIQEKQEQNKPEIIQQQQSEQEAIQQPQKIEILPKTFDDLVTFMIWEKFKNGELDLIPEIELQSKDDNITIMDKPFSFKVKLQLKAAEVKRRGRKPKVESEQSEEQEEGEVESDE